MNIYCFGESLIKHTRNSSRLCLNSHQTETFFQSGANKYIKSVHHGRYVATLTKKKKVGKNDPQMVDATILAHDFCADHGDLTAYYFSLDEKPSFSGKDTRSFTNWVNAHLVYPPGSRREGSEGTVKLQFTIDQLGDMTNLIVLESSGDPRLDAEAYRVVNTCPRWKPGTIKGKPVKVTYTFPVIFQLRGSKK